MLYRRFYSILQDWHEKDNKRALLIQGASQIGKTTLIREFGKQYYGDNFVEINFINTPSAKTIFDGDISVENIVSKMTLFLKRKLKPKKTLIFLDEVQECPQIRTCIKFLVEDGRFDYIESGSLLGLSYNIKSFAVGFEDVYTMYPMDFEEFIIANNVQKSTIDYLKDCYNTNKQVDEFIHREMLQLFTYYLIIGGMPSAVNEFVKSRDMGKVLEIQTNIVKLYRLDITKYSEHEKTKITNIFDTIPSELNSKNKRFMLSGLVKTARMERYESCFNWLNDAGITLPCYNITQIKEPIAINKQHNLFKLFMSDVGLLNTMYSNNLQFKIINGEYDVNEGSIMENVFAEQLKSNGFNLYYYDKIKYGEVDFIVEKEDDLIPIEIKSGNDYKRHKALNNILDVKDFNLNKSIVFCKGNIEVDRKVTYYPFYMIMFFHKENMIDKIKFREIKI